jgi:hypothetical protein
MRSFGVPFPLFCLPIHSLFDTFRIQEWALAPAITKFPSLEQVTGFLMLSSNICLSFPSFKLCVDEESLVCRDGNFEELTAVIPTSDSTVLSRLGSSN